MGLFWWLKVWTKQRYKRQGLWRRVWDYGVKYARMKSRPVRIHLAYKPDYSTRESENIRQHTITCEVKILVVLTQQHHREFHLRSQAFLYPTVRTYKT